MYSHSLINTIQMEDNKMEKQLFYVKVDSVKSENKKCLTTLRTPQAFNSTLLNLLPISLKKLLQRVEIVENDAVFLLDCNIDHYFSTLA